MERFVYATAYLGGETLLHLKSVGKNIDHTRYLAQTCDAAVRDICHMHLPKEGQHVVLAQRVELDVLYSNCL